MVERLVFNILERIPVFTTSQAFKGPVPLLVLTFYDMSVFGLISCVTSVRTEWNREEAGSLQHCHKFKRQICGGTQARNHQYRHAGRYRGGPAKGRATGLAGV